MQGQPLALEWHSNGFFKLRAFGVAPCQAQGEVQERCTVLLSICVAVDDAFAKGGVHGASLTCGKLMLACRHLHFKEYQ